MVKRKFLHDYFISDNLWTKIKPLLPLPKPKKKSENPRKDNRLILRGISYLLLTGCQWKSLPKFTELQVPSMIDFRKGKSRIFLEYVDSRLLDYDVENIKFFAIDIILLALIMIFCIWIL